MRRTFGRLQPVQAGRIAAELREAGLEVLEPSARVVVSLKGFFGRCALSERHNGQAAPGWSFHYKGFFGRCALSERQIGQAAPGWLFHLRGSSVAALSQNDN
jgi:hypothetical protein